MEKIIIESKEAPAAIGPYSQAVKAGNLIFTSGQLPIDPVSGEIVSDDIEAQTSQALENLKNVLLAAGSGLDMVIKTTLYIRDMNEFTTINNIYADYFKGDYPARTCVEVSALPKGALVEIEAFALKNKE